MDGINILWLVSVIGFIILEASTYQLVSIWFVFGAIGGLIASLCEVNFYWQMVIFLGISVILLLVLRPVSMRLIKQQDFKSNSEGLIGKTVLITEDVSNIKGTGQGKVDGMVWTVRGETDEPIQSGETVKIKKIEGVKLIVEKLG